MAKSARVAPASHPPDDYNQQWLILRYAPVSLFSLRTTFSTSKGGKTLLVPTPYSVKMALIDATFRAAFDGDAIKAARHLYDRIKDRRVKIRPPAHCVVQNTFIKIRQDERGSAAGLYASTIAYRELVQYQGELELAIQVGTWSQDDVEAVQHAAMHVNYLGKRGSFFQHISSDVVGHLQGDFTLTMDERPESFSHRAYGVSQFLDDFGPALCRAKDGFERISTFHENRIKLNEHRVLVQTLVPYKVLRATRSFTRYGRLD